MKKERSIRKNQIIKKDYNKKKKDHIESRNIGQMRNNKEIDLDQIHIRKTNTRNKKNKRSKRKIKNKRKIKKEDSILHQTNEKRDDHPKIKNHRADKDLDRNRKNSEK